MRTGPVYSLQGLAAFLAGSLLAAVVALSAALQESAWIDAAGRYLGYALGGAAGGAGLAWGFGRRAVPASAVGFGVGFVFPALFAAPLLTGLSTFDFADRPAGAVVAAIFAFGGSYGVAGAIGMAALRPGLAWTGALRFLVSGALGGAVAAAAPACLSARFAEPPAGLFPLAIAGVLGGHALSFALGGFLAGKALELDTVGRSGIQQSVVQSDG